MSDMLRTANNDMRINPWGAVGSDNYIEQREYWIGYLHRNATEDDVAAFIKDHPLPPNREPLTTRERILDTAKSLIVGDRQSDYGPPLESFSRLAQAFNLVLRDDLKPGHEVTPTTAAALMIALKLSRLSGGDYKDDTWVDLAGYAALGAEVTGSSK